MRKPIINPRTERTATNFGYVFARKGRRVVRRKARSK